MLFNLFEGTPKKIFDSTLPLFCFFDQSQECGSVAEWSKALVLGTSLFGGVGNMSLSAFKKALLRFELRISCLLDRRFNQLSHSAI